MNHIASKKWVGLAAALVCSLALTLITLTPPTVLGDWARLDANGRYIPPMIDYQWPGYDLQVALWLGIVGGLWLAVHSRQLLVQFQIKRIECRDAILGVRAPNIQAISPDSAPVTSQQSNPQRRLHYTPLIIITLLGLGLRLHTLGRLPLLIDEIGFAARASDILRGQHIPIFAPGHNGNPATFSWLLAGAMDLWGQNTFVMRLLSLACGMLCIPAAYRLGRAWWGRRVGLLAACLLAVYPAHVHFSRLALYNAVDPLFALLALTALTRAMKGQQLAYYVMAGALAGVAQYFYHGSRLLPVLMAAYVILEYQRQKHNTKTQRHKDTRIRYLCALVSLRLCVVLLSFVLLSLPRFASQLVGDLPLTGNLDGVRLPSDLVDNTLRSLLAWVGQADVSPFWLSSAPLLPVSVFFAWGVGVVMCLRRWRDPRYGVLLLALALTTVFGGVIWAAAPLYVRYIAALPAIVLLVAIGIHSLYCRSVWLAAGIMAVVMIQCTILSLQHPAEAYGRISAGLWEEDRLAREAADLPAGEVAEFAVSSAFGAVERITLADYVAAYGQRRAVIISPP